MHACIHAYLHACIHAYMHTCIHAYMHTCIHTYMHTCVHAYIGSLEAWIQAWGVSNGPVAPRGCQNRLRGPETNCNKLVGPNPPRALARLSNCTIVQLYNYTIGILVYWYIGWYIGILEYWRHNHTPDLGRRII